MERDIAALFVLLSTMYSCLSMRQIRRHVHVMEAEMVVEVELRV
jgi:hypothetical protein